MSFDTSAQGLDKNLINDIYRHNSSAVMGVAMKRDPSEACGLCFDACGALRSKSSDTLVGKHIEYVLNNCNQDQRSRMCRKFRSYIVGIRKSTKIGLLDLIHEKCIAANDYEGFNPDELNQSEDATAQCLECFDAMLTLFKRYKESRETEELRAIYSPRSRRVRGRSCAAVLRKVKELRSPAKLEAP